MSFEKTPLNEFITLQRGFDLPKGDRYEGTVPVIASTGVGGYHNIAKVGAPGVVIGRSGSIGGGQYIQEPFWPLNTTLWVKDFKGHDPRYIYYLIRSIDFTKFNVGSGVPTLNRNHISSLLVNELGIVREKVISKQLGDIDDKIALNTQTNQTLEQMAQAIFKSWFVDFDPVKAKMNGEQPEGMDEATASLFPEKLVESELGLIPEGWTVKPFKKVIDKYVDNRGKTPPVVEDGIPLVEVKHLPENSAFPNLNTDKRVTEETFNTWFRVHVEPKDVLISTVGTIGRTSFVKNTNFGIAQNVLGLRFGKVVEPEYMFYTIKAHRFQHDMDARSYNCAIQYQT